MRERPPAEQRALQLVSISPPPEGERVGREARRYEADERRDRYALPISLDSHSPVGYRSRPSWSEEDAQALMPLLSLEPPTRFITDEPLEEQALFDEVSLGILSSRQSTNFKGLKSRCFGPAESEEIARLLSGLEGLDGPALTGASHTQIILTRRYQTPFTALLTLAGHKPFLSLLTVPLRILRKRFFGANDIPTIGYLPFLHLGILADQLERAAVVASEGRRKARIHLGAFLGQARGRNKHIIRRLESLCRLSWRERREGWHLALVAQVGAVPEAERIEEPQSFWRRAGATLLSLRSERIQPGINQEPKAPAPYQSRQAMDVPDALTEQAGRAAYNAFCRWTGIEREQAKSLLLLDRVDVLTPNGKSRLRQIRRALAEATDCLVRDLPLWADLPTGRAFSRNAARGRKAFALAGQRIYISGLSRPEVDAAQLDWELALCAAGAAAGRSSLYAELCGCVEIPEGCDLLAGTCIMAGPVNQNDIGKSFYGHPDLLDESMAFRNPTSLLLWTLKAKTVADPIGNEEQLLSARRKGSLVDLRCGPHELVAVMRGRAALPLRAEGSRERAFGEVGNFVLGSEGEEIEGNSGTPWPEEARKQPLWG